MTDQTEAPKRELKQRVFRVEDGSGHGGYYRAKTPAQARAFHTDEIVVREASIDEIIAIGQRGLAVGGMEPEVDAAQIDAFADTE